MLFNDLLQKMHIDPKQVIIFRHCPTEPQLNKVFPWLAAERPDLFNAYQQAHSEKVEQALKRAKYVASFIGHQPGKALFIGLYEVLGSKPLTLKQFWDKEENKNLKKFGMTGYIDNSQRPTTLWFELVITKFYADWKGKLIVGWPGLERSWWRWADRNDIPILAIVEDSTLISQMPEWDQIELSWNDLKILPAEWKSALTQWRGIYYIFDSSDGKSYIGSAYGEKNILGRWLNYASRGHGGNKLLPERDPSNFRFTILQRVSPDMDPSEVIRVESSWKQRLHTRTPYGLNDN
jgi:hypothetical protein